VYVSGLPYSLENARVLHRALLWSAHKEDSLLKWYSSNVNADVHAFVENRKYCVVNNTGEAQQTVVYTGGGGSFELTLRGNEIRWLEI
jgi:1,3-beta-galactosyl-N-acetylhexosamine phosphorylase